MRIIFYFLLSACFMNTGYSQTGIGTTTPDPSAQLEVSSTEKGILIPRMTEMEKDAIVSPAEGLLLYQTDGTRGFYFYDGMAWVSLMSSGSSGSGSGAIIPFASGATPVSLAILYDGAEEFGAAIGFGAGMNVNASGVEIDLTTLGDMAFSVPRNGVITSVSAYFSTSNSYTHIGTDIDIIAQVYASTTPDNIFSPVDGAEVVLAPTLTGVITSGTISSGHITGLNIPVTVDTRLMLVFTCSVEGVISEASINGYASGGVAID